MEFVNMIQTNLLDVALVVMALLLLLSLLRAIIGPRFTDRVMAVNMVGTQALLILCILAFVIGEQYLVDLALIFALLSFLAVVAMVHIFLSVRKNQERAEGYEAKMMTNTASKTETEEPGREEETV